MLIASLLTAVVLASTTMSPSTVLDLPANLDPLSDSTVVVYLVRHAEKADDGTNDPPLTIAGQIRGQTLSRLLGDAGISSVYSTDYKRTRETTRPLSEAMGLEVKLYSPRDLQTLAEEIRATSGHHLVVGHSNTTPGLVELLGGDRQGEIDELEYDRLYMLILEPGRPTVSVLLRYGEPFVAGTDFGLRNSTGPRPQRLYRQ